MVFIEIYKLLNVVVLHPTRFVNENNENANDHKSCVFLCPLNGFRIGGKLRSVLIV